MLASLGQGQYGKQSAGQRPENDNHDDIQLTS